MMSSSLKLFTVRGVDVRLHFTFPLILVLAGLQFGLLSGNLGGALFGVVAVSILFGLVTLHELGHSFAAQHYGIHVERIVLSPLGGVAQLREMPEEPRHELVIAAAGPAVNFAVAALMVLYLALTGASVPGMRDWLPGAGGFDGRALFNYVFVYNLVLAAFNLLPAFPLDGGRILRALLALRMDYVRATNIAAGIGRLAAVALGLFGLLNGGIFMVLIAVFIFGAAGQEAQYVAYRRAIRGYRVEHVFSANAYRLTPEMTLKQAYDLASLTGQSSFAVVNDGRLTGFITQGDLLHALRTQRPYEAVATIMRTAVPRVTPNESLEVAEMRMEEAGLDALPVVSADSYLGLLTRQHINLVRRHNLTAARDQRLVVRQGRPLGNPSGHSGGTL